jgi:hypothetical protein
LIEKILEQKINSKEDYERRKKIFMEDFIGMM